MSTAGSRELILFATLLRSLIIGAQYQGSGSVTQGIALTIDPAIYSCPNGRVPAIGSITASDNTTWTVPAEVRFSDASFPFAFELHNPCTGATFNNTNEALGALTGSDVVVIDPDGELITGFVFADNYFEMLINGVPVGKDDVPYTQFNSNIVRFRVHRPFTIAVLLVDWEEHLGIGTEASGGYTDHPGDGGLVAVFKDEQGNVLSVTGQDWKAQVFYTAPIMDLACAEEIGPLRLSSNCGIQDSNDGTGYFGLHWPVPAEWSSPSFDDTSWPAASIYSNAEVGVNNKPAYMNFTDVFDDPSQDAAFIWSTNLVLDNQVIVRHRVDADATVTGSVLSDSHVQLFMNESEATVSVRSSAGVGSQEIDLVRMRDTAGRLVLEHGGRASCIDVSALTHGLYMLEARSNGRVWNLKFIR